MGWDDIIVNSSFYIYKIDLSNENYNTEEIPISNKGVAELLFGYDCVDNLIYLFGGGTNLDGFINSFSIIDLSQPKLEFQILSNPMDVPTGRRGHAMEAYNDILYIFGGVDSNGKR
jgi:hypothetical protein